MQSFLSLFESAGYALSYDERKRRYLQGMIRLVGDLPHMVFLRQEALIRLFSNAQLKKGTAYSFREMIPIAQPRNTLAQFQDTLHTLAGKQILLRGYRLKCPQCDLELWYGLDNVDEHTLCEGCRMSFQLPLELDFAYRLNQLFIEGINQGSLTVLLTALLLNAPQWDTNLILKSHGQACEIDLIAQRDSELMLIECKDNFAFDDTHSVTCLCDQLRTQITIAEQIGASQFIFATLYDDSIPDAITDLITNAQTVSGRIITRHELLGDS